MTAPTSASAFADALTDDTSSSGLITNTARNQLAAAMANPTQVTGNPADNAALTPPPRPAGLANPYGMSLSAFEPNTEAYVAAAAGGSPAAVKQAAGSSVADAASATADGSLTPEQADQSSGEASAATHAADFAGGGIVDATGKVQQFINAALHAAALRVPYVWGGTGLTGLDCSGLVYYAAQAAGIQDWKRYRATDYLHIGSQVDPGAARPGDLVVWNYGGGQGHVGIYLGNGQMVAAPQSGQDVQVEKVWGTPTYRRVFTDNQFGTAATPTGSTTWSYAGQANPWARQSATAQAQGALMAGLRPLDQLFGSHRGGFLNDSQQTGREAGQYSRDVGYSGGTIGGQLLAGVPYANVFQSASATYGVPASLLAAVAHQESGFNPSARSGAGAIGLMQFMPGTAAGLGVNPLDPTSAINGAARYLQGLYHQFGSWQLALAAYNAGAGNVAKYGGIPPFAQTQSYVNNVSALAQRYAGM